MFGQSQPTPFVRAYAPDLEAAYRLKRKKLLSFIDGLNEALAFSCDAQIPSEVAAAISRTKRYMKKANESIFLPRGLHAQLCRSESIIGQIGMSSDSEDSLFLQNNPVHAGWEDVSLDNPAANPIAERMRCLGDRVMKLSYEHASGPKLSTLRHKSRQSTRQKLEMSMQYKDIPSDEDMNDEISRAVYEVEERISVLIQSLDVLALRIQSLDDQQPDYQRSHKELSVEYKDLQSQLKETASKWTMVYDRMNMQDYDAQKREHKAASKVLWLVIAPKGAAAGGDDDWNLD